MKFHIEHQTEYRYSRPVFLEPHTLRLSPRHDAWQRVHRHEFLIQPRPAGTSTWTDAEGNTACNLWFTDLTETLSVTVRCDVETLKDKPFDYLPGSDDAIPLSYGPERESLELYLRARHASPEVSAFVNEVKATAENHVNRFLPALNEAIHARIRSIHRADGLPYPPAETLALGEGACRDMALLFVEACRCAGIAARFVSGYHGSAGQVERELHAWPEVYLPGGGWRGYDPTEGLAVTDHHVALAASADPALAAPITGTFRGTGATLTTTYRIDLDVHHKGQQQSQGFASGPRQPGNDTVAW